MKIELTEREMEVFLRTTGEQQRTAQTQANQVRDSVLTQLRSTETALEQAKTARQTWENKFYTEQANAQNAKIQLERQVRDHLISIEDLKHEIAQSKASPPNPTVVAGVLKEMFKDLFADSISLNHKWNKINVIKHVRVLTGFGLKEAKDLVEEVLKPEGNNLQRSA